MLTPAVGSVSPGATPVVRTTGTVLNGAGSASSSVSIKRYFDIQPAVNTGLNVTMDFSYFNHELNGITTVALFKSVSGTGGPRANQSPISTTGNTVTKTGIADFSIWTLGNGVTAPLPVELTAFAATRQGADAQLSWNTASERANRGFEVQVSTDGRAYRVLEFVAGAGSSSTPRAYAYLDREAGKAGLRYYRLRQLDLSGAASFSPVRTVAFDDKAAESGLTAVPNPFNGGLTVRARAAQPATQLTLFDATGRPVLKRQLDVPAGSSQVTLAGLEGLATGVYLVQLTLDGQPRHLKLVKE